MGLTTTIQVALQPNVVSSSAAMRMCAKRVQRQRVVLLHAALHKDSSEPNGVHYNFAISVYEKRAKWRQAAVVLAAIGEAALEADVISYSALISACEKGCAGPRAQKH